MNEFWTKARYALAFAGFFRSPEDWRELAPGIGLTGEIDRQTYSDLLWGTDAAVIVPRWASAAREKGSPLLDGTTLEVLRCYLENGFAPERPDGNPPDDLGEQFRFLAYLYDAAPIEPEAALVAADFEQRFTKDTVRAFSEAAREHFNRGEVPMLLDRMAAFLEDHLPPLPDSEAAPAKKREPPLPLDAAYTVPSAGIGNCGGKCKINIRVQAGCALEISTDDTQNGPALRACARGWGYRRTFLSPERLRYPMERIGRRGEGKFRRISWDEAAEKIAAAMKKTEDIPESRYFMYATGNCGVLRSDHMLKRLCNLTGGYLGRYNSYSSACSTYVAPYIYGSAECGNSEQDMLNSKLLILWGHNPAETRFGTFRNYDLAEAKRRGIPIIVIDPRQSDTALALADQWIPLRPSTDGALADAMAYVIVTNGLHDLDFLHRFCVGFDEQTLPEGAPKDGSYESYLLGRSDGIEKTPAWGEMITGVPAGVIEELAIRYATTKPAAILPGWGPQRHGNGEQETRAIAALACLTGNVGRPGGSAGMPGYCPARPEIAFPKGEPVYPGKIPSFLWPEAIRRGPELDEKRDGLKGVDRLRSGIKLLFNLAGNTLINQHSDINGTVPVLQDESACEFIVVSDLFMTASAKFADLLLPAASLLECDNISMPWANDDFLLSNARAVEPLFGAMPDYDWVRLVARKLSLEAAFTQGNETDLDWLRALYREHQTREPELPEFEEFRQNGGWVFRDAPNKVAFRENIEEGKPFATLSGKIELFSMQLYELHDPEIPALCRYHPAVEGPADALREKYPLQLIGYHTKRRTHSIHDRNDWLEALDPPALWIHPADAKPRGIENGAMVEVFNDRGRVRIPAKVTDRIMQGVTALSQGGWYTPDKDGVDTRGSINVLTALRPTPLAKGNPQHTNLVEVVRV